MRHGSKSTEQEGNQQIRAEQIAEYVQLGLRLVPLEPGKKKPSIRWGPYQRRPLSRAQMDKYFGSGTDYNVGAILGPPSGGLACRDFDQPGSYESWAKKHPIVARKLPTASTRRGHHVYFLLTDDGVDKVKRTLCRDSLHGAVNLGDGELRAGPGCLATLPPSVIDGTQYRWLSSCGTTVPSIRQLSNSIPTIDPVEVGLVPATPPPVCLSSGVSGVSDVSVTPSAAASENGPAHPQPAAAATKEESTTIGVSKTEHLDRSICATLPSAYGQRHEKLFEFSRRLQSHSYWMGLELKKPDDRRVLELAARDWHARALPNIRTKDFVETLEDFVEGWEKVRSPYGSNALEVAIERAQRSAPPPGNDRLPLELRKLDAVMYQLQLQSGDSPCFISTRDAAAVCGYENSNPKHGCSRLRLLEQFDRITTVKKGQSGGRRATRFRHKSASTRESSAATSA